MQILDSLKRKRKRERDLGVIFLFFFFSPRISEAAPSGSEFIEASILTLRQIIMQFTALTRLQRILRGCGGRCGQTYPYYCCTCATLDVLYVRGAFIGHYLFLSFSFFFGETRDAAPSRVHHPE